MGSACTECACHISKTCAISAGMPTAQCVLLPEQRIRRLMRLQDRLGELVKVPTLAMLGGADEFVPPSIDSHKLCRKFAAVLEHPQSRAVVIEGAGHSLTGHEEEAVDAMIDFVQKLQ